MSMAPRSRSSKAVANDAAIREAGVNEIVRVGVDRLSLREVGAHAGLTHGATYARHEDAHDFLADLWNVTLSVAASDLMEMCTRAAEDPSALSVGALLARLREHRHADRAAVEVLLASRRIPVLHEVVESFIDKNLVSPMDAASGMAETFSRFLFLVAVSLSCALIGEGFAGNLVHDLESILVRALRTTSGDAPSPTTSVRGSRPIVAGNSLRQELEYATCLAVGRSGYHGATISRIARIADCSPGAIYKMYKSKEDLVVATFGDTGGLRWIGFSDLARVLEPGVLSSLLTHECGEANALRRNFLLEMVLAAHDARLSSVVGEQMADPMGTITRAVAGNVKGETLRRVIEPIAILINGMRWLTTISPHVQWHDFSKAAESYRLSIIAENRRGGGIV